MSTSDDNKKRRLEEDETKPEAREVKVKLEEDDTEETKKETEAPLRTCVVCFRDLPLGEESAVCRNQLASSSSSSASSSEVKIRGEHCHCLECFQALPRKQCSVCKAPFFAVKDQVMDLDPAVVAEPKPKPLPPPNPYDQVLRVVEDKGNSDNDANMVAALIWENERCRLLREHSPIFVASFLHRIVAANRLDFIRYLIIRERHELARSFRAQLVQERVAANEIEARVRLAVAKVFLHKLSTFFIENRSSRALARVFVAAKETMWVILSGAAGPVNILFSPHPEPLRSFAVLMNRTPETASTVLGTWFCTLASTRDLNLIQWVLADDPNVTPLLDRLNADCFSPYMRSNLNLFATRYLSVASFEFLVAEFPWLVDVAWADFQLLLMVQGKYHPLAPHLYQKYYDQVPVQCRYVVRDIVRPVPPELEPWEIHYLFDPVAVKWYCAPHKHIADKNHYTEIDPHVATRPGTRVTILGQEPLAVDPVPVNRLHVFYFARANADGSNPRSRGDASFWDIPSPRYDNDRHSDWRYWKLGVLAKTVGAKRIPLIPGTTLVVEHGISEHNISLMNTLVF